VVSWLFVSFLVLKVGCKFFFFIFFLYSKQNNPIHTFIHIYIFVYNNTTINNNNNNHNNKWLVEFAWPYYQSVKRLTTLTWIWNLTTAEDGADADEAYHQSTTTTTTTSSSSNTITDNRTAVRRKGKGDVK
jgi:hypothetical protein